MSRTPQWDDWVARARTVPIADEVARRAIKLARKGHELVGPCPKCGGNDRFGVNLKKAIFNCRGCGAKGDVIALAEFLDGVDFVHAVETLTGEPPPKPNGKDRKHKIPDNAKEVIAESFPYEDANGDIVLVVDRIEYETPSGGRIKNDGKPVKTFRQRRPDPDRPGKWIFDTEGAPILPYRLPELIEAVAAENTIWVVEGERKADLLRGWNIPATCCAGGHWRSAHSEFLRGAIDCVIVPDNDKRGREYVGVVANSLRTVGIDRVRVLALPGLPPKGDVVDWARAGGTVERLIELAAQAPEWTPTPTDDRSPHRLIRSSAEFVANFVPPEYVIDGILQRRFIYSLTGTTGAGKTAIMLLFAAIVALERTLGERGVERGRVLYFAGENPDDARMRWIAMSQQMDFDHDNIDVHFIPGTFKISEMMERIRTEITAIGEVTLIIVDTSAAYFEGDSENDNTQQGQHARRLRSLATMPGGPCVLVACHPPKNASNDNLQPRGGGSFIAEIDGNLTARKSDGIVELHTQGKFRGPDFAPVSFQLRTVTHERLKDSKGRLIPTVVASHLSEAGQQEIEKAARSNEDQLLAVLAEPGNGDASHAELAKLLGWSMRDGSPYKVKVKRAIETLTKAKLVTVTRDRVELTAAGRKAVNPSRKGETE